MDIENNLGIHLGIGPISIPINPHCSPIIPISIPNPHKLINKIN